MEGSNFGKTPIIYPTYQQPTIFDKLKEQAIGYLIFGIVCIVVVLIINYYIGSIFGTSPFDAIKDIGSGIDTAIKDIGSVIKDIGSGIKTAVDTLKGAIDRGIGIPLGCGTDEVDRASLCYKKCNDDEETDGTQRCYKNPPIKPNGATWPGGKTVAHLQHNTIYSPVGFKDTIPDSCKNGKQIYGSLCYDVPDGWKVTAPGFIGEKCENIQPGFTRDDGTGCWIDADTYGRGVGRDPGLGNCPNGWANDGLTCREPITCYSISDCFSGRGCGCSGGNVISKTANSCNADEEKWGALCYPKCKSGYSPSGCCTCLRPANVKYRKIESRIGTLPDGCPGDKELRGRLCYPKCQADGNKWPYERTDGNLEYCTSKCPDGWTNIGIGGCERPFRDVGMGIPIHTCAPGMENDAGLCYPPCDTLQEVKNKMAETPGLTFKGVASTCFPML